MELWGPVSLTAVVATGTITQLYPNWNRYITDPTITANASGANYNRTTGDSLPISDGGLLLSPAGGRVGQAFVETDSTDGGILQLFDINGLDDSVDVSSATAITDAQYVVLRNLGRAKLLAEQNFAASPGAPILWVWSGGFLRGLAARFVGASGTCAINITGEGGFLWRTVRGTYSGG